MREYLLVLAVAAALWLYVLVAARLGLSRLGRGAFAVALRGYRAQDVALLVALRALLYASFALFVWSTLPCLGLRAPLFSFVASGWVFVGAWILMQLINASMGEGGAIGPPAAIVNAINDALSPFGVSIDEFPATPQRIRAALRAASARGQA